MTEKPIIDPFSAEAIRRRAMVYNHYLDIAKRLEKKGRMRKRSGHF